DFKGGSGSASRVVKEDGLDCVVAAFVQANFGIRRELNILGITAGKAISGGEIRSKGAGSIIAVIATDAPLLPHQLKRLAKRVPIGLARTGAIGHNSSGDIFLAFSVANAPAFADAAIRNASFIANAHLDPLFEAVAQCVEEAVLDSMIANESMTGANGLTAIALPHDRLLQLFSRQNPAGSSDHAEREAEASPPSCQQPLPPKRSAA